MLECKYSERMKVFLATLLLLFAHQVYAQNFEDDFSDGDFTNNPTWSGADSNFVIFDLDGNNVLRLNDNEASSSYLSTPSSNVVGEWEFFVRIDGGAPSNSNRAEIYLMSDAGDLSGAVNGYAIRIGQTGDDVFSLVRVDGGAQTTILQDTTVFQAGGEYRIKVTRDGSANWTIEVGEGYNGELKDSGNSVLDNTYTSSSFFGVLVAYTSTRTDDYYFDFKIDPPPVIIEPVLVKTFEVTGSNTMEFSFTRDIDFVAGVEPGAFILNGLIEPTTITELASDSLEITFEEAFPGGENEILLAGIESSTNDTALVDTLFQFFVFEEFESGDVIINEFLKDPPTGSGLSEYIELRNTSSKYLNLRGWEVGDNSSLTEIADEDLVLLPDSFLVVTPNPDALTTTFGEGVYVDISLPALNNTTDQIRLYDSTGNTIDSLEYTPDWGGVDVALERRSPNIASTFQANWGDSPNGVGTPGRRNDIEPDTTPPDIESYEFLNDSTIQIIFTEEIKETPAANPSNYNPGARLDNDFPQPMISEVQYHPIDTVIIFFETGFIGDNDGEYFSFIVRNQEDIFGNVASDLNFDFELREFDAAQEGEVVINEFMYDPADGFSEFVELYNRTDKTFDLRGWTFNDNSGNPQTVTNVSYFFEPGSYVVLAVDSTIAESFPGIPLIRVSGFPALNNSTDDLVLRSLEGLLIDSLTYTSDWGGDEVSLERKSVEVSGVFQANWGDSPSSNLGTPGLINEIEADEDAPFVLSTTIIGNQTIRLIFSESPTLESATNQDNYEVNPVVQITGIRANLDSVFINVQNPFTDGQLYEITVSGIEDIFGNTLIEQVNSVTYFEVLPAERGDIVINEILYRRLNELSPEFVELVNPTEKNIDLSGWELIDAGNNDPQIPEGTFLPAGEYLVLTDREDFANSIDNGIYLSDFPSLNDSGDEVVIRDVEGITIDSLFYESDWGGNTPGVSLERRDPAAASNDPSNWGTSTAQSGFSAGTESSLFEEDVTAPEIIFSTQIDTAVKVVFSEFIQILNESTFNVNGNQVNILRFDDRQANEVFIEWKPVVQGKAKAVNTDVRISNIADIKGNTTGEISSPIASPISRGGIVINEIMYDPLADSDDNLPDQTEYIELYNPTNEAISLEGITIHDAPDEDDEIRIIEPVSSEFKWIPAGGYFLIYSEDEAEVFTDSRIAQYFSLEGESDQFTMRVDRSSLSLASTGDAVYVADSTGTTVDSVFYDESWQNPNVFDTDGIALERINPEGPSNSESNWSSSTDVSGGTPTMQNTIFQEPGSPPSSSGISFSPNPFSPDDDGFEDNLFINYTLDAPDYLLRVRIFDRYGREVRELADGIQAGFEGSLIWDGLTDDRRKNRVGIYIVLFEAYNSASGSDRSFKETVVLARMF